MHILDRTAFTKRQTNSGTATIQENETTFFKLVEGLLPDDPNPTQQSLIKAKQKSIPAAALTIRSSEQSGVSPVKRLLMVHLLMPSHLQWAGSSRLRPPAFKSSTHLNKKENVCATQGFAVKKCATTIKQDSYNKHI